MNKVQVTVRVDPKVRDWFKEKAKEKGTTFSYLIMEAMRDYMQASDLIEELGGETMIKEALKKRLQENE